MDITFQSFEMGVQKTSNQGNQYTVNTVSGVKTYQGQETPYSKDYFPNSPNADELNLVFGQCVPGDKVRLSFGSDKFRSLVKAEKLGGGGAPQSPPVNQGTPAAPVAPVAPAPAPAPVPAKSEGKFRDPAELIRGDALTAAVQVVTTAMANAEAFTKMIKKSATLESVNTLILTMAAENEKFITGKLPMADPESTDEDLTGQEEDTEQPDIPA